MKKLITGFGIAAAAAAFMLAAPAPARAATPIQTADISIGIGGGPVYDPYDPYYRPDICYDQWGRAYYCDPYYRPPHRGPVVVLPFPPIVIHPGHDGHRPGHDGYRPGHDGHRH